MNNLNSGDRTICSIKQLDADTVEIVKRKDQNLGIFYRYFGLTQKDFYERVTISRKDKSTAVDRLDGNWWQEDAFVGRRDLFFPETRDGSTEQMAFVRHDYWLFKPSVFFTRTWSNLSAFSYGRAFKATAA